jgi:hypothetical protein
MTTAADITAFVNQVVAWDDALQACADKALASAASQFHAGTIDADTFNTAVTQRSAVAQAGAQMTGAAVDALGTMAAAQFSAISAATTKLSNALKSIQNIEKGVNVLFEAATVAATVVAAVATPSVTSIAAAVSAVNTLVTDVLKPAAPPAGSGTKGGA